MTVYELFPGYLYWPSVEFFETPAAGHLRWYSFILSNGNRCLLFVRPSEKMIYDLPTKEFDTLPLFTIGSEMIRYITNGHFKLFNRFNAADSRVRLSK